MRSVHAQEVTTGAMAKDRATELFFELFSGLPRLAPGSPAGTRRALGLVPGVGPQTRMLDIGCGTGAQSLTLARSSPLRIIAVDNHPPYIDVLNREAHRLGIADRLEARVADMRSLDFPDGSFDLIWCEGAIYTMGVETALRDWRRLLRCNGHVALTEVCWRMPGPPAECAAFWSREYPAIRQVSALLETVTECGYEVAGHFPLPASAWWDDYYRPLQDNLTAFRERHRGAADAQDLADQCQREIDIWHACSEFYGYEFLVLRTC